MRIPSYLELDYKMLALSFSQLKVVFPLLASVTNVQNVKQ